ncbi:killer toxin resistant protein [Malassezia yamatoensis]|uniref:Killer toxin resistant protein n=1 Tax=Malassezia yamatoensis TaxID=253288 RepID=A0AAJ5YTY7_9BASI|nr:killer toxin resistant protein [Malassezia yamatoensis]
MVRGWLGWCFLTSVAAFWGSTDTESKSWDDVIPVNVYVQHAWHHGDGKAAYVAEMLEAAHSVWPTSFFYIMDRVSASEQLGQLAINSSVSARDLYDTLDAVLYEHAQNTDSVPLHHEWRAAVAMHTQAADVEAYYQLYQQSLISDSDWGSCAWMDVGSERICDLEEAKSAISSMSSASKSSLDQLTINDHVYAPFASAFASLPLVILYADLYDPTLGAKHKMLMQLAQDPQHAIQYILRWKPSSKQSDYCMPHFSGFGAALHLKKVDYLVIDDRKVSAAPNTSSQAIAMQWTDSSKKCYQQLASRLSKSSKPTVSIQNAVAAQATLSEDHLASIGPAAAHVILKAFSPLRTLTELLSNFPAHAANLAQYATRLSKDDSIFLALDQLQSRTVDPGVCLTWLNGKNMPLDEFHPLELLQRIREERNLLHLFAAPEIGIDAPSAQMLLTNFGVNKAFSPGKAPTPRYDASDRRESQRFDASPISWRNDLREDGKGHWPSDLKTLLQPRWPGQPLQLAQNFFNLVLIPNVTDPGSIQLLREILASHIGAYGLHFGITALTDPSVKSQEFAEVLYYALDTLTNQELDQFLREFAHVQDQAAARKVLIRALKNNQGAPEAKAFCKTGQRTSAMQKRILATNAYLDRLGVDRTKNGAVYLNGESLSYRDDVLQAAVAAQVAQTRLAAKDIQEGSIESVQIPTYFYDLPDTQRGRFTLLSRLTQSQPWVYVNLPEIWESLRLGGLRADFSVLDHFKYHDSEAVNVSLRIVADVDHPDGKQLVLHALHALKHTKMRLNFVHIPTNPAGALSQFLYAVQKHGRFDEISVDELASAIVEGRIESLATSLQLPMDRNEADSFWKLAATPFVEQGNCPMLIINGLLLSEISVNTTDDSDIAEIVAWEQQKHVVTLLDALDVGDDDRDAQSEAVEFVSSLLGSAYSVKKGQEGVFAPRPTTRINLQPILEHSEAAVDFGSSDADIRIAVIMDPLSDHAPSMAASLQFLANLPDVHLTLVMNPRVKYTQLPLQRFSQFDARLAPQFHDDGHELAPGVSFALLPAQAVLTMQLFAPRTLVTMAEDAVYDLDNIRLADIAPSARKSGVQAGYTVRSLLVEGHARAVEGDTPHGLQLLLTTAHNQQVLDTIVMENMGYFQFRAQPGLWSLQIRDGRSADVYEMQSLGAEGWNSPSIADTGKSFMVTSLLGKLLYPVFQKQAGMLHADLIAEMDAPQDEFHLETTNRGGHADINIFTLASGHLYERMTYIMILSVLEHTHKSVKFWFVENFLSPSFKAFLPHLAKAYHFQYEMITYAWPKWLREQTEKQRMIWAYKILFLDVLFPLDLERVIFVDADQIVRADLMQLVEMDLHGAPYGYPPMGDDSEDMDGFRFWKQGYWRNFLRGRTYHISALYVVDLQRFRAVAAGDLLRRHYQRLTADPNSLANLDQDLPNHLQQALPIFTLDKTWLWCETWCSYDWLPQAKTIDLCSNPKTKEPKLDRARRQIPEWNRLDAEVAAFAEKLAEDHQEIVQPSPVHNATESLMNPTSEPPMTHDEL